ncbi:MAG: glycosyltransferase family 2 protein, partial [Acidimicrobiales bacterium]
LRDPLRSRQDGPLQETSSVNDGMSPEDPAPSVAIVIPCRDEAITIRQVVEGFQRSMPDAAIIVCDNGSNDQTASLARAAGARVIAEPQPGKGRALRRLLADVDADCYVMVDGDATYDPATAPAMVAEVLDNGVDMVVARRVSDGTAFPGGHTIGNRLLTFVFQRLFRLRLTDTLSGYRALSRRFVKTFPVLTRGFEVETDLNAHAASLDLRHVEIESAYTSRPTGSHSKLGTWRDGFRILRRMFRLFRDWRPLLTFSLAGLACVFAATVVALPIVLDFLDTGLVERQPTLIAVAVAYLLGFGMISIGMVLERIAQMRREVTRLLYLSLPAQRT